MKNMKKINKILVPIFALTSIAPMALVSVSCKKQVNTCVITFNSMGGSDVQAVEVSANSMLVEPTSPSKDRYIFDGWYIDEQCQFKYDFSRHVYSDFTLYAKWSFSGQVDQNEWEHAINLVIDCTTTRNYIVRALTTLQIGTTKYEDIDGAFWAVGTEMKYCTNDTRFRMCSLYEKTYKKQNWLIWGNNALLNIADIMKTNQSYLQTVFEPLKTIKSDFSQAKFDPATQIYTISKGGETYKITFNSEKKIQKFEMPNSKFHFIQYGGAQIIEDPMIALGETIWDAHYYDQNTLITGVMAKTISANGYYVVGQLSDISSFEDGKAINYSLINSETGAEEEISTIVAAEVYCSGVKLDNSLWELNTEKNKITIKSEAKLTKDDVVVINACANTPSNKNIGKMWVEIG